MSSGRGRGYTGRHHLRETKPGDDPDDLSASRTLSDERPRSSVAAKSGDSVAEAKPDDEVDTSGDEEALQAMLNVDEQFAPLLVLLEQFTPGEDGIQFNRKLRHFETTVTELCPDEARLQQAFATFRAAALQSSVTNRKLAAVGAAFTRQQRQGMLRASLLNIMQATFTKLEVLERANPLYLINAANLMGDYFAEARLCNGKKVHILAGPLVQYMRSLLASDDIRAHRSLATQLLQNGRELLSMLSPELDELSISIRLRLLTPPPISIIWLLLSSDLCLNKFLPLPNTIQQFYASHLDLTSDDSFSEVTYGSWKTESVQVDDDKPKLRPILGAGAGLLKQEQCGDDWKPSLSKRYDLNTWRQDEKEPTFNPNVPPPNYQEFYPESYYLQQGDGVFIQNVSVSVQGEKVNSEMQKSHETQFNDKRFDETKFNDKRFDETKFNDKRFDETKFNDKRFDETKFNDKRFDETKFNDKRFDETKFNDKRFDETKFNDKRFDETKFNDKRFDETKFNDKRFDETKFNDKRFDETKFNDKRFDETKFNDKNDDGLNETKPNDKRSDDKKLDDRSKNGSRQRLNSSRASVELEKRRHVSDVPRNHKYWDHDDRCDKDYNS